MKKFINQAVDAVEEMLQGLIVLHPGLARLAGHKVIVRADASHVRDRHVAIISGGGSGHEPAHAGYIGSGMLSAAVAGEIFTSPSSDSVFAAIKAVAGKPGVLLVVKNYTGDRLNFGLAAEMARAEGMEVETVLVNDDVALKDQAQATGARGLAGTVLIHKLLGAAAYEGRDLADLVEIGKAAVKSLATMGVSFSAGTSPIVGKPSFDLGESEMELGLGIHGEPGVRRTGILPADQLTEALLTQILKHGNFGESKPVAVMINNLGATTNMELAIVSRSVVPFLQKNGYTVKRIYAGTFLSSLDMPGISISVLGVNDEWLRWLDAETTAPAWPRVSKQEPGNIQTIAAEISSSPTLVRVEEPDSETGKQTKLAIEAACTALIDAEAELTELDRLTGDGDLGASMERAAKAVLASLNTLPLNDIAATFIALGHILRREFGGSSGPLYGVLFLRCGKSLEGIQTITIQDWAEALEQGCRTISELGGAKPGDRTMLDALEPFAQALQTGSLLAAVAAAERGVEATVNMKPRLGRSSYLGDRVLGHPDPGAKALALWLRAAATAITQQRPH